MLKPGERLLDLCPGGGTARNYCKQQVGLKVELQCKLYQARVVSLQNLAECRIGEIPVRVKELSFVRDIKNIRTELEILRFADRDPLGKCYVGVVESGPATDGTRGGCELAKCWIAELCRI